MHGKQLVEFDVPAAWFAPPPVSAAHNQTA
jgi:hypothetical protein